MSRRTGGLDRGSLTTWGMTFFTVSASAPMTVIAGAVVATYAVTGVAGVPLSFLVLMLALWPFTVGYTAMGRHVSHAGVFYAFLARGLGRVSGVAGGLLALLAYNAIQICLYGLLGASMTAFLPSAGLAWWGWALIAWAVVGILGVLHININARVLAVLLVAELIMIVLFDLAGFGHPAGGRLSLAGLAPGNLFTAGIGGVLAFGIASFVGYESGLAYSEEARGTGPISRATFTALIFLGVLYSVSALAMSVTAGPKQVGAAAGADPGLPFTVIGQTYGGPVATFANLLLITSILGAMISFHNTVSRYVFALARERVLPQGLGRIGSGSTAGSPIAASLTQSGLAVVVFLGFAVKGLDPVVTLFTWLSAVAALAIGLLMAATSAAVARWFSRNPQAAAAESGWATTGGPILGAITLAVVFLTTVYNIGSVLGTDSKILTLIIPGIVVLTALAGLAWGLALRASRPDVYQFIGEGERRPLETTTPAFSNIHI